jgi:oligopeptide transport system substrate-binding protein
VKISRIGVGLVALAAATSLVLSGCAGGASGGGNSELVSTNGSEPQNPLIPTNTNETGGGKIIDSIFAGLVYYDANGAPVNEVAESITTDDNQTYTIKLQSGWKFTNWFKQSTRFFCFWFKNRIKIS